MSGELPAAGDATGTPSASGQTVAPREGRWWISLLIAILAALTIRHFVFQAYKIPSGSMIPSLLVGDQLIASKFSYGIRLPFFERPLIRFRVPDYGEVAVFRYPEDVSIDFIKRTIARPGDRIRIEAGEIYVNDEPLRRESAGRWRGRSEAGEPPTARAYWEYHGPVSYMVLYDESGFHPFWNMPEVELGPDQVFMLGDNRDRSNDSRKWGPVGVHLLEGYPLFVHWSWDSSRTRPRWSRIGTGIN